MQLSMGAPVPPTCLAKRSCDDTVSPAFPARLRVVLSDIVR